MKKLSKAIGVFTSLMVLSSCIFSAQAKAAAPDISTELAATTSYYETYLADLTTFNVRGIEDVLLCLKGGGTLRNEDTFLSFMEGLVEADGTFKNDTAAGVNYDSPEVYALMLLICEELVVSTTDFNGCNLVDSFSSSLTAYDASTETVNPYFLKYIGAAIDHFEDDLASYDELSAKLKTIIMSYYENNGTEIGINYWGINADNNGAVLPALYYLYDSDAEVKKAVDDAVTWSATFLEDNGIVISWGSPSVDSTGLLLSLLASYDNDKMDLNYEGLLTFKDASTAGAYASSWDVHSATRDAYYGLLAYSAAKEGKFFLDYEEEVNPEETPTPEPSPEETPKTGDSGIYVAFAILMVSSLSLYLKLRNIDVKEC